ncbi:hypothetical protein ACP70R_030250 [Stipagrostis hirtigluma subsp. patula]
MERHRQDDGAEKPLLVRVVGSSGDGRQGDAATSASSFPTSSPSWIAAVVGSTAVAGSFEFGISASV